MQLLRVSMVLRRGSRNGLWNFFLYGVPWIIGYIKLIVKMMPIHLITATHLKNWRGREPQGDLPTLVRDLVWSTACDLEYIAFPGGDSVYRPGFDGTVVTGSSSVYVPEGVSIWEIGTDSNAKNKAEKDYKKRTKSPDENATFVFVTPKEFRDKEEWCKEKRSEKLWKDVRVYDADDVENWLSVAPSVSILWADKIANIAPDKIVPLISIWDEWQDAMDGFLSPELVTAGVERSSSKNELWDWIEHTEPSLLRLKTYSPKDGQLFISASLSVIDGFGDWLLRCVSCEDEASLRQLVLSETPLFIITCLDNVALAKKALSNGHKYCIIYSHTASNFNKQDTVISVPLRLSSYDVRTELEKLGMNPVKAEMVLRKSGRMLMALRRELAGEHPCWLSPNIGNVMSAIVLVSGWNDGLKEDIEALESLSGWPYADIERTLKNINVNSESPIQYVEPFWKLLSPMDAWRCLGPRLTKADFERFRSVVIAAFTSPDPVMDLPADKRWAAAIYEKRTPYSSLIRMGLLQSLMIIAEFGNVINLESLTHPQFWIDNLVADIFKECLETKKWESLVSHLPNLAEASPNSFLDEIERRLKDDSESLRGLFLSGNDIMSSSNMHVQLIWALERLAWFPEYVSRVVLILTELHELDPGGNMHPRPMGSLTGVFCFMRPQTMLGWEKSKELLCVLLEKNPVVGRALMLSLLPSYGQRIGNSVRPDWREISTMQTRYWSEVHDKYKWVCLKLIDHFKYDGGLWADLLGKYTDLNPENRKILLDNLNEISHSGKLTNVAVLRKQVGKKIYRVKSYFDDEDLIEEMAAFDKLYYALEPENILDRFLWLFDHTPHLPTAKYKDDYEEEEKQLMVLRSEALEQILEVKGVTGVLELSKKSEAPHIVAYTFALVVKESSWNDFYKIMFFADDAEKRFFRDCIVNIGRRFGEQWVKNVVHRAIQEGYPIFFGVYCCFALPNGLLTWEFVEKLGVDYDNLYWKEMRAYGIFGTEVQVLDRDFAFNKLVKAKRSGALLDKAWSKNSQMSYQQRVETLDLCLEHPANIINAGYRIREAIEILRNHPEREDNDVIRFEWVFAKVWDQESTQLTIHKKMAEDIGLFKEVFKNFTGQSKNSSKFNAGNAFSILRRWTCIPGSQDDGSIDSVVLTDWINEARIQCADVGKENYVDHVIGEVLAHAPVDEDGLFPCKTVCNVLEVVMTESMMSGFVSAIFNKRGVHSRGLHEGGQQERDLAKKYENWAESCSVSWPKVAKALRKVSKSYESKAKYEDRNRLHNDMLY